MNTEFSKDYSCPSVFIRVQKSSIAMESGVTRMVVRAAQEQDAQAMIDLLNPLIEKGIYTIMDAPLSLQDQLDYLRAFPARGVFNVAVGEDDQRLAGLQSVEPLSTPANALKHVGEISTFVALDAHRQGVGRRLCQATFQQAKEMGFLKLCATIRADNPAAVAFYLSQGFQLIGTARKHAFVQGKYIDEILAEKILG